MSLWRIRLLARGSLEGFVRSGGTRLAAAIAYYALLSLFPLVIVIVAGANALLPVEGVRDEVVDRIVEPLPLSGDGSADLRDVLLEAGESAGAVGIAGLVGLLWTAGGLMGAIRSGLTEVTGDARPRPFLRGKAVDILMVLVTGLLFLCAAAATIVVRVADEEVLGPLGLSGVAGGLLGAGATVAFAAATFVVLLRFVPARPVPWRGALPGALAGAVALYALATGFGLYVGNFGRYNAVYGSLGAVAAFLVFAFLAAIVLLVAASLAACWPEVADRRRPPEPDPYGRPASERVRRALAGLVVRR
ncbi:YihY/virulence factor BrkB family protein [Miltoncostaea marina]|uniref:YihY/virulence factor BrkB family protein n=1 Tax=Miltoncostaea marina TaxID=2843215 RepID=UPI001C3DAF5D|nr:YihY/virulence factor BrkB family protein [Miltoncostaea marina]